MTSPIDISTVHRVYSGRQGCACGCRGTYKYASAFAPEMSKGTEDVSDRSVKILVGKLNKMIAAGEAVRASEDGLYITTDMDNGRVITAYLK